MIKMKTFKTRIVDKLGWEYRDASIIVRHVEENICKSREPNEELTHYTKKVSVNTLAYTVSFWPDEATRLRLSNKGSRPLFDKVEGESGETEYKDVFVVDMEHPEVTQVQNSGLPEDDTIDKIIELDFKRRLQD
tara:strand:+ start:92 stop:493 length:402 start_codon:yes stop_codon:yes gene_type:complete